MVIIPLSNLRRARQAGSLMIELVIAVALLVGAVLPFAYGLASEKRLARSLYQKAVAMEILDGEMERLAAGAWRAYPAGTHDYTVSAAARKNLPAGKIVLTVRPESLRLEWRPERMHSGGRITREWRIQPRKAATDHSATQPEVM